MRLTPAMRIGGYEVVGPIGAGAMGEVYRAHDMRLRRDVALKVLPARFHEAAPRARFEREARMLASLNHPHVAAIYGVEEVAGVDGPPTPVLVLELVEGETLRDRIGRGPVPIDDAVAIARQIAEALEAAHDRHIVHRDLKPANVKVMPDGTVKVLDFGLAKALDEDPGGAALDPAHSPTLTTPPTLTGEVVGTPAYMAPEQVRGKAVDRRADIWAFGAVLYEMLTGARAFPGATVSDTLAAVLTSRPGWNALPPGTPQRIRRLLQRCLEPDPRQRLQAIGEARIALSSPEADDVASPRRVHRSPWHLAGAALAGGTVVALALLGGGWRRQADEAATEVRMLDIAAEGLEADVQAPPVVSPDGRHVVYRARGRLWVRALGDFAERPLPSSDNALWPFWAPDSRQVAFVRDRQVWRVSLTGGDAVRVGLAPADLSGSGGGVWTPDGTLVLSGSDVVGLYALPLDGGPGREVLPLERPLESDFHEISSLPDGRGLLFSVHRASGLDTIAVYADGARRTVLEVPGDTLRSPVYSRAGYLLFQRASSATGIWAIRFDLDTLQTSGDPFLVVPGAPVAKRGDGRHAGVRASVGAAGTTGLGGPHRRPVADW